MKEIEEMSIKEIAECLNLSTSNVKVRLHRAKSIMKEKYKPRVDQKELLKFGDSHCDSITYKVMMKL